ncbi:MAG: hypothetical protein IH820_10900 [Bacteroidetes bacterium]|nr:hypothetical protein [Bacteroidota bacterium]
MGVAVTIDGPQTFNDSALVAPSTQGATGLKIRITSEPRPSITDEHAIGFETYTLTTISGNASTGGGSAISGVSMTIAGSNAPGPVSTGAAGNYTLANIQPGSFTITPVLAGWIFAPTGTSTSVIEGVAVTSVNFTGTPSGASVLIIFPNGNEVLFEGQTVTVTSASTVPFTRTGI